MHAETCTDCGAEIPATDAAYVRNSAVICSRCHAKPPSLRIAPETRPVETTVEHTCAQCGATYRVSKLAKGAVRFCPNCGAAGVNPAERHAGLLALAEGSGTEEALSLYNRVLEQDPGNVDAWVGRGSCMANLGRAEEAIKAMEQAIRFAPHDVKQSLRPRIGQTLFDASQSLHRATNATFGEYCQGTSTPNAVLEAWVGHLNACWSVITLLNASHTYRPADKSAPLAITALCKHLLDGMTVRIRNENNGPSFVFGPMWFVAAATVLPYLMQNGQVTLYLPERDQATARAWLAHYMNILSWKAPPG